MESLYSGKLILTFTSEKKQKEMVTGVTSTHEIVITVTQILILAEKFAAISIHSQNLFENFGVRLSNTWSVLYLNPIFSYMDHTGL